MDIPVFKSFLFLTAILKEVKFMKSGQIFGKHKLSDGEQRVFSTDEFLIGVKREKEGWYLSHTGHEKNQLIQPDLSAGDYFQTGKSNSLLIVPALPIKPLVFKGNFIHVAPGQKFSFFLKVPLTIQVFYSKNQPANLLKEIPVSRFSDTWFGDPYSGEPAFLLGSEFFRVAEEASLSLFDALCPVNIFNNSPGVLKVERLIIRVENMTLYNKSGRIVTSLLAIEYKGKEIISSASYHFSKVHHGEKEEVIAKPRSWASKNLLKINFHFIKNILQS